METATTKTMDTEPTIPEALETTATILTAIGEPIGAALFASLAARARDDAARLEAGAAEAREAEARRFAQTVAHIAAESDGVALDLDGGPSDLGAAEWLAAHALA